MLCLYGYSLFPEHPAALETPVVMEETPSSHSMALRRYICIITYNKLPPHTHAHTHSLSFSLSHTHAHTHTHTHTHTLHSSVLKGVHSLSSLRKRSIHASTAQTPHSVTFHDHITVAEYSPDKSGRSSADSTLDSTTLSPPAPTSQRDNTASGMQESTL